MTVLSYPARPEGGYPSSRPARQNYRDRIREQVLEQAEAFIARAGRSINCGDHLEHDNCVGVVYCICDCHDLDEG